MTPNKKLNCEQFHDNVIWEFLFCSDPRVTPAKSKSTRPFIWKAHMIGHVDFDLAGGGDMPMLEIERIVNFLLGAEMEDGENGGKRL